MNPCEDFCRDKMFLRQFDKVVTLHSTHAASVRCSKYSRNIGPFWTPFIVRLFQISVLIMIEDGEENNLGISRGSTETSSNVAES